MEWIFNAAMFALMIACIVSITALAMAVAIAIFEELL